MLERINTRTMKHYQVIDKYTGRGYTHIRVVGGVTKHSIRRYLSRHANATFLPTTHEDLITMIVPNKSIYILKFEQET